MTKRQRGFSLIEMMMVIGILGILMAMGLANYRRMQTNNEFNMEAERFAGELGALSTEARALGTAPATLSGAGGTTTANTTIVGRFRWTMFKSGQKLREGNLGERQDVTLVYPQTMANQAGLTTGIYLRVDQVVGNSTTPRMVMVFRPDGTPFAYGDLVLKNPRITKRIKISSMGAIQGPTAE